MVSEPTPQRGDVIFILSGEKLSHLSCLLQRALFDTERVAGPWFSHAAIVLNDSIALEASTLPDSNDPPTWSRVQLGQGVRLILLPDLLIPAKKRVVLRHPKAAAIPLSEFEMSSPHIAGWYGSEYSIRTLRESAETAAPLLAKIVPPSWFDWSSPPDDLATKLGLDPDFRAKVAQTLPAYQFAFQTRSFFCSQLVVVLLWHAGLLDQRFQFERLTPSGLFDVLHRDNWADVTGTDYGDEALEAWSRSNRLDWEIRYLQDIGYIQSRRNHYVNAVTVEVLEDMLGNFSEHLDNTIDRLKSFQN
jgi:hypothetical protein